MNIAVTEDKIIQYNAMQWDGMQCNTISCKQNAIGIYCALLSAIYEVWHRMKDKMTDRYSTEVKIESNYFNIRVKLKKNM